MSAARIKPLSPFAVSVLADLRKGPWPAQEINPGVMNRFLRGGLVDVVDLPSPYKTVKGLVGHARITEAGLAALKEVDHGRGK